MWLTLRVLGRSSWWAGDCAREGAREACRPADVTTSSLLPLKVSSGHQDLHGNICILVSVTASVPLMSIISA